MVFATKFLPWCPSIKKKSPERFCPCNRWRKFCLIVSGRTHQFQTQTWRQARVTTADLPTGARYEILSSGFFGRAVTNHSCLCCRLCCGQTPAPMYKCYPPVNPVLLMHWHTARPQRCEVHLFDKWNSSSGIRDSRKRHLDMGYKRSPQAWEKKWNIDLFTLLQTFSETGEGDEQTWYDGGLVARFLRHHARCPERHARSSHFLALFCLGGLPQRQERQGWCPPQSGETNSSDTFCV